MRPAGFFPPIDPHTTGMLDVGDGHSIYWEACGNPEGRPALFLHGGPGGGCSTDNRRLFDPEVWNVLLFDQRGAGRSRPLGGLEANTTPLLLADIERLRALHGVERFDLVLGGSWGATLALSYAQAHRERVRALVLRGVFTARAREIDWLYGDGAAHVFPEAHDAFLNHLPESDRADPVPAYHRLLTCGDQSVEFSAAAAWCAYEGRMLTMLHRSPYGASSGYASPHTHALARIEAHYFVNRSFMEEGQILARASLLADLPGVIVQGRYDMVTPPVTAHELHRLWPASKLEIVPDAGHATVEPGVLSALVAATKRFARD